MANLSLKTVITVNKHEDANLKELKADLTPFLKQYIASIIMKCSDAIGGCHMIVDSGYSRVGN